jgi:hypothetical protein
MKHTRLVIRICTAVAIIAGVFSIGHAQNREKHVISAKAGGVNAVTGHVMVTRSGQGPQLLSNQDDLVAGDLVTTGDDSQAEILLNPGSYLRLAENSELTLIDNSLDNLLFRLNRGSAIIEATGTDYTELRIGIAIGQERLVIVRRGIYRLTAEPTSTEVLVRKGRVQIGNDRRQIVKGGHKVAFSGGTVVTAKLAKSEPDEFDNWSKERGKTLARANEKLSSRLLNGYLALNNFGWASAYGRSGLWTFSPSLRCYTFLPFYDGWATPYGNYYGNLWPYYDYFYRGGCCNQRPGIFNNPIIVSNPSSGGSTSGPSGYPAPSSSGRSAPVSSFPTEPRPRSSNSGGRRIPRIDQ